MFKRSYKYDVAISVAEEDQVIAEKIIAELKERHIRYYYYKERAAESWGEYIIHLTDVAYGKHSRFVLLITSSVYVEKYWSGIERQVALSKLTRRGQYILQLRLDTASVGGISEHMVSVNWKNNPAEIANLLLQKIEPYWRTKRRTGYAAISSVFIAGAFAYSYFLPENAAINGQIMKWDKVWIAIPASDSGRVDSFCISNTEVTVAQFRVFCESEKHAFPAQPIPSNEGGPVRNVTWDEAVAFCKWAGGRLPKENEWEYAAEGGATTTYSGGNNASKVAVYNRKKPGNVAQRAPNQFGLYDMTGNVAEWCEDWYDSSLTFKVVRGGSYNSVIKPVNELYLRRRDKEHARSRSPCVGFRVVWEKNLFNQ